MSDADHVIRQRMNTTPCVIDFPSQKEIVHLHIGFQGADIRYLT